MKKNKNNDSPSKFYGITTVGERGQIVIPSEMRKKYKISKGEKFMVAGFKEDVISLLRMSRAKDIIEILAKEVEAKDKNFKK